MQREEAVRVAGGATRADTRARARATARRLADVAPAGQRRRRRREPDRGSPRRLGRRRQLALRGRRRDLRRTAVERPVDRDHLQTPRALDPAQATVSVRERVYARPGAGIVRKRRWEITLAPDEEPILLDSAQTMRGGFEAGQAVPPLEQLARGLARALGFAVPDDDVGQREY